MILLNTIQTVTWVKDLIKTEENFYMICVTTDGNLYSVPLDEANSDYQVIQEWVADGNTIEESE